MRRAVATVLPPQVNLAVGWNLVPVMDPTGDKNIGDTVEDYFQGVGDAILGLDNVGRLKAHEGDDATVGSGYWVYTSRPAVLLPPNRSDPGIASCHQHDIAGGRGRGLGASAEFPLRPSIYHGTLTVNGAAVPDELRLIARIGEYESPAVVTESGRYAGLIVLPPDESFIGRTVTFHLNGMQARETDSFAVGRSGPHFTRYNFNLTFSPKPTPASASAPTPTNTPTPTPTPKPIVRTSFGPVSGSLRHDPDDGFIPTFDSSVNEADFVAEATFTPHPTADRKGHGAAAFCFGAWAATQGTWWPSIVLDGGTTMRGSVRPMATTKSNPALRRSSGRTVSQRTTSA